MRELTTNDRTALLAVIGDFEKVFGIKCDHLSAYIWLSNYDPAEIHRAFEITDKWRARKIAKGDDPTELDLHKYAKSVMRNRSQAQTAVEKILGEGGVQ
jgi:hypothetical protein